MRIRERYRRRDFGHMDLEMTLEDPKYYTQPFTIKPPPRLRNRASASLEQ